MPRTSPRYALRFGARDMVIASRALGVLYVAGGMLVASSMLLRHPQEADARALLGISGLAVVVGAASMIWAKHARSHAVHALLAAGTVLICLSIFFSGTAAGIYPMMFFWVVLLVANFFDARVAAAQVVWILISWGVTLTFVPEPTGFSEITRWILGGFVFVVAATVMSEVAAGRASTEEQLRCAQAELELLAYFDPLTGVANRRLFETDLTRELARAHRHGTPVAVVALDLDRFKEYNDEHGHAAGDRLLQSATRKWARCLRAEDLIARIGGDEFVALLADCPPAEAERAALRLGREMPLDCSCSTGIAFWNGHESPAEFLARADAALYESKKHAHARAIDGKIGS